MDSQKFTEWLAPSLKRYTPRMVDIGVNEWLHSISCASGHGIDNHFHLL